MRTAAPPAYAWDWLARQRVVWQEARRRLLALRAPSTARHRNTSDVPDWSVEHPDVAAPAGRDPASSLPRDYSPLDTRAEVIAALREDYRDHPEVRRIVDAVVTEIAFLGRTGSTLEELGLRTSPRGLQWWWTHLTGNPPTSSPSPAVDGSEPRGDGVLQLRLLDLLAGYGDEIVR